MANQVCRVCEQRPAAVLVSMCDTGDTTYVCVFCLPWWTQALWEGAGLPELTIDVADQDLADTGTELPDAAAGAADRPPDFGPGSEMTDEQWERSGAEGRPPPRTDEAPTAEETSDPEAADSSPAADVAG